MDSNYWNCYAYDEGCSLEVVGASGWYSCFWQNKCLDLADKEFSVEKTKVDYTVDESSDQSDKDKNCIDISNGATDRSENGCEWYTRHDDSCGAFDHNNFVARKMCCACKNPSINVSEQA